MKAKKSKTFLSVIALLLVLAITPVSSGAFAQTADDEIDESIDQANVADDGTVAVLKVYSFCVWLCEPTHPPHPLS